MSLKKIALVALIVVMTVSSIISFGCKRRPKEEVPAPADTEVIQEPEVVPTDTIPAPPEPAAVP